MGAPLLGADAGGGGLRDGFRAKGELYRGDNTDTPSGGAAQVATTPGKAQRRALHQLALHTLSEDAVASHPRASAASEPVCLPPLSSSRRAPPPSRATAGERLFERGPFN